MAIFTNIIAFTIFLYSGLYILFTDRRSLLNRILFFISMLIASWAFAEIFLDFAYDKQTALFWIKISSVSWGFLPSLFLHFVLIWFNKERLLNKWWIYVFIYLSAGSLLMFLSEIGSGSIEIFMTKAGYQWTWNFQNRYDMFINLSYIVLQHIYIALSFILIIYWSQKTKVRRKREQARLFLLLFAFVIIISGAIYFSEMTIARISTSQLILFLITIPVFGIIYLLNHLELLPSKCSNYPQRVLETIKEGIIWAGQNGKIKYVNSTAARLLGYEKEQLISKSVNIIFPEEQSRALIGDSGEIKNIEKELISNSGSRVPTLFTSTPLDRIGKEDDLLYIFNEIKDLKENEKRLMEAKKELEIKVYKKSLELANQNKKLRESTVSREKTQNRVEYLTDHDDITGLINRKAFMNILINKISDQDSIKEKNCIMFLDIDNFKFINDTYGHNMGDKLLNDVGNRLKKVLRKDDIIARLGGDEFIILLDNLNRREEIETVAEKIISSFIEPFSINNQTQEIKISMGITIYPEHGNDAQSLIKNAEIAMYEAKDSGKNNFKLFSKDMKSNIVDDNKLIDYLYKALERNEFEIYYQPQVHFKSEIMIGMEAFIRWNHPEMGLIYPERFIPAAEKTELIIPIEEWMIKEVCQQNKRWQEMGLFYVPVSINLSTLQFQMIDIAKKLEKILQDTGLDHEYLEIEVEESIVMQNITEVIKQITKLKKIGIKIAISNFGLEYSSLQYLKELPIDRLKIAMSFIHGIGISKEDEVIIKIIINLARNMGMKVAAEGVETREQLEFLVENLCAEIQGYYYYNPMPADDIEKLGGNLS